MKKTLTKKVMFCMIIMTMMFPLLQGISLATDSNVEHTQMIKKSDNEYIIYVSYENESNELVFLNEKFEFAFSNEAEVADKSTLVFQDSALDQAENGNHIAYVDSKLYSKYFEGKENTYLWVKQESDYKLESEKINLTNSLTEETIQKLNNVTKMIKVTVGEKTLPTETINEVKVNHKIGTLTIDEQTGTYSHKMLKATEGTDAKKLIDLAEKLNKVDEENMFNKLSTYNEFKALYNKLKPEIEDDKWTQVENYTIEQPENSKTGEQYLVWLKNEDEVETNANTRTADNTVIDVQIMTCVDEYIPEYEKQEIIIKETTKLPITGDNITLFVIAGVILILIIIVVVLKLKENNVKEESIKNEE